MATVTAMGNGDSNGNNNGNGNVDVDGNRDGNDNCNGNGHGKDDNNKGRVASSCTGNVQRCGRGDTFASTPMDTKECAFTSAASWG
jgi:hypothetical protein